MLKPFPAITTSSHGIVMKMLSAIMSKPFFPLQLVSRYSYKYDVSYMSKYFVSTTASSHQIVMKMLSVICQNRSPPMQLVVAIQSCKCCQIYVKAFHLHYNQQSRYSHDIATKILPVTCQNLSSSLQLIVTTQS